MGARNENKKSKPQRNSPNGTPNRNNSLKKAKRNEEPKSKNESTPSSFIISDEDPDFPRGGASLLSREEVAEARAEAEAEFEREKREGGKKGKKRTRRDRNPSGQDDDLGSLFSEGTTGKLPRFANRITLKNISPNIKLWGVVVEVNSKDLVISLPGGLRGFVRTEEMSDIAIENEDNKDSESSISERVAHIGQLVPCIVVKVDDDKKDGKANKRIWLSLRLSLLHTGLTLDAVQDGMALTAQVNSVEDHGYILYFGVSAFNGFMPKRDEDNNQIKSGQLLQCVVKSVDRTRAIVHLSSDPDLLSKSFTKDLKGLSIDHLIPGMMVNARVTSTLENGLMLSFLTYFTGTVDFFHLPSNLPTGAWKVEYSQNKKVVARILFIDPSTRAVGLTLNADLVHNRVPPINVKTGEIYDECKVLRVDKGIGLLVEVLSSPVPSPAYIGVHDVSDEQVTKLEKKFKEGSVVRVRILVLRHLEGLATGTLKASAFEGSVFTHSDVKPGMLVKAKIVAIEDFGAIVQFSGGVKALCPLPHMSELDIVKTPKKFKVGVEMLFRVLGCKSKRITVTHKKTLVKSKLGILASYADATEGLITHGWITKIENHGCFVKFYNGVNGFAHRSELGLDPGVNAESIYHAGQVMKCRVVSSIPSKRRISLSFVISPKRISANDNTKPGSIVSGVVEHLTPAAVIVIVNGKAKGIIHKEHLADCQGQASALREVLKPGYNFDQLLVLDIEGNNLVLSAKNFLISSASEIPSDVSQIRSGSLVHGYICNIIEAGCFVRFLGHLTGFSPKHKATDEPVENIQNSFYVGQSVRSHILDVNAESGRIKLSLQQSLCSSSDVSFIQGYFLLEEKIAALQNSNATQDWAERFRIGSLVEARVDEIKEFGIVVNFKDHSNVVGFVSNQQLSGTTVELQSSVKAVVLDVSKSECLVDLSLKPELVSSAKNLLKKKRQRATAQDLELHEEVNAVVEIVKDNYLVLSIPEYSYAIGYASVTDFNSQKLPNKHFAPGQSVTTIVGALSNPELSERLLLLIKNKYSGNSSSKRAKKKSSYRVGSLVEGEIIEIKPLELIVKFGIGQRGRVHITEVLDDDDNESMESPFAKFRIGESIGMRIIAKAEHLGKGGKGNQWELSLRPSLLSGDTEEINLPTSKLNFSVGNIIRGYVVKVDTEWVRLAISRHVSGHIYILDTSSEPSKLEQFQQNYKIGQAIRGQILNINKEKRSLRLSPNPSLVESCTESEAIEHIKKGDIVGGRVKRILPGIGGIMVQIGPHLFGRVHYTEIMDDWVSEPVKGFSEGQFVKTRVLDLSRSAEGTVHVDLSLRSSLLGDNMGVCNTRFDKIDDLHPDMDVPGYVKNISTKGCFIMLSRNIVARILISHLSDDYIENPEKEFPVGKLVHGRILSVETSSNKVEVTLKKNSDKKPRESISVDFSNLHVGNTIRGIIRRVELYGLFITIEGSKLVGLCHKSELSDEPINDLHSKYKAGDRVEAKILKLDEARNRIALGMKKSYFEDENAATFLTFPDQNANDTDADEAVDMNGLVFATPENNNFANNTINNDTARAYVPPLQVSLDESDDDSKENNNNNNINNNNKEIANGDDLAAKKSDKRAKKKAKEQRELEISALEERSLKKEIPRNEEEFEKLVRSSPNSSFVWINYMAFLLDVADVEKARSIAERALRTINIREEEEKLNIWVAYFNLENEYGNPPEEAVKKTFQRALQYCDPKKLHLALLGMYERTEQHKLSDELLEKMTKKFRASCKVWLRCVQNNLKQGKDNVQSIMKRALLSLPQKKHIKFISQTAILEFKSGVPDRGRSLFEGILREYPKRTDLWSVYLDQEIRLGDSETIRGLFERATCLSLSPKKMKFLFKKYLEYEKAHGDKERVEHVKRKALEFVESSMT